MRIGICGSTPDFFQKNREILDEFFKKEAWLRLDIYEFSSGEALLADREIYDIVYLDLRIPNIQEGDIGNQMAQRNEDVIVFMMASGEHTWKTCYPSPTFYYLAEPYDKTAICQGLEQAVDAMRNASDKIIVETEDMKMSLSSIVIVTFSLYGKRVMAHTLYGDFITLKNWEYWEEALNKRMFYRPCRGCIINLRHVDGYDRENVYLDDGSRVKLSSHVFYKFREALLHCYEDLSRERRY